MTHTTASIPVDLKSPGQVLACMGFLEAAEVLLGGVEAYFDWREAQATFVLRVDGDKNPFVVVLEFLSKAKIIELTPIGYVEGGAADRDDIDEEDATPSEPDDGDESDEDDPDEVQGRDTTPAFPSGEGDRNALPVQLVDYGRRITISHWADGSSREPFKLYSGNRSARLIASNMLGAVRSLWNREQANLLKAPFDVVMPIKGKFNLDPRAGWIAIDAGYSPKEQAHGVDASPLVELLAAIGLEHARPMVVVTTDAGLRKTLYGKATYAVWGQSLPPMLARAALVDAGLNLPQRRFNFDLRASGKNKVTTFAQEETKR
jgi:CRISPR-associated protein Csx14